MGGYAGGASFREIADPSITVTFKRDGKAVVLHTSHEVMELISVLGSNGEFLCWEIYVLQYLTIRKNQAEFNRISARKYSTVSVHFFIFLITMIGNGRLRLANHRADQRDFFVIDADHETDVIFGSRCNSVRADEFVVGDGRHSNSHVTTYPHAASIKRVHPHSASVDSWITCGQADQNATPNTNISGNLTTGSFTAASGAFVGPVDCARIVVAGNILGAGQISGATAAFNGVVASGSVDTSGIDCTNITGVSGVYSGNVSAGSISSTGAVSGASATIAGAAAVGTLTGGNITSTGQITGVSGVYSGSLSSGGLSTGDISSTGTVSCDGVASSSDISATAAAPTISVVANGSDNRDATVSLRGRYLSANVEHLTMVARYADSSSHRSQGGLYFEKYISNAVTSASGYAWPTDARREVAKISYDGSWANCGVYPMYSSAANSEVPIFDVGTSDSRFKNAYLANAPTVSSDRRLKIDIEQLRSDTCLGFILSLRPSSYRMKNRAKKSRKHTGFIADEVLESLKRLGCQDPHELSSEFGIYTHPRERETVELPKGELGDVVKDTPEVGSYSSLRYTEFIAFLGEFFLPYSYLRINSHMRQ